MKRVIGLKYEPEQGPPRVVLKGAGATADQVLEHARQMARGPAVVQDEKLLDRLYRLPVEACIDSSLFQLVAVLLVHVYAADEELMKEKLDKQGEKP